MSDDVKREGFLLITTAVIVRHNRTHIRNSGPKGRRFKSCHLDQKTAGNLWFSGSFLFILYKAPSLALFSCNGCATLGKGPKTIGCKHTLWPLHFGTHVIIGILFRKTHLLSHQSSSGLVFNFYSMLICVYVYHTPLYFPATLGYNIK